MFSSASRTLLFSDLTNQILNFWRCVAGPDAKGLAKLGNIVPDANVSQFSCARNMCCGNKPCCSENKKMFLPEVKNIFTSRTQTLRPKHMFPSLATPGNMFPSLAKP